MGRRRTRAKSFYDAALSDAERAAYKEARAIDGLDDEIAVLRLRLRTALEADDAALAHDGMTQLVRALLARHRINGDDTADLSAAAISFIEDMVGDITENPPGVTNNQTRASASGRAPEPPARA
ncbi:MAG: hypothetical protein AB7L91_11140 [Dehalococcoidia bacterium]